ncbi:MAG: dephospho-CoA kinase [Candidatus Dormiibacterota bacterium]
MLRAARHRGRLHPRGLSLSRVIGLTGGIASGKSTVAGMLAAKGAWIVDADQLARRVVGPGTPALSEIARSFGPDVIAADGSLDRSRLAELVFADESARQRLNAIVHPGVLEFSQGEIREAQAAGAGVVVYDVPLLFETQRQKEFDGTLVVWVEPQAQLLRLRLRSDLSEADAMARIAAQMPLDRKRELADWVIDNSGTLEATRELVDALWRDRLQPQT